MPGRIGMAITRANLALGRGLYCAMLLLFLVGLVIMANLGVKIWCLGGYSLLVGRHSGALQ